MNKLIVGLGNPGNKYKKTRHNIGWQVLGNLPFAVELNWKEKYKGLYCDYSCKADRYFFLMPQTFMNLSGQSVSAFINFFKIEIEDVLVLHDELDIDFGTLSFKKGGGLAGHNGLKSIHECTGSKDFLRMRLGIGRPELGSPSSWVLSEYSKDQKISLDRFLKGAAQAIELYISDGFEKSSSEFSKKSFI